MSERPNGDTDELLTVSTDVTLIIPSTSCQTETSLSCSLFLSISMFMTFEQQKLAGTYYTHTHIIFQISDAGQNYNLEYAS